MKLLNIPVEMEKYQKAVNKSPNNMAWMEWLDCVFTARTGLLPPRPRMSNTARIPTGNDNE